jgi:Nuclease-related domain
MWVALWWFVGFLALMGLVVALLWTLIWWLRRSGARRRSPLARNLLRNPGDSLRPQIEDLNYDFLGLACLLVIVPLAVYSIWISQVHFGVASITGSSVTWIGVVTLGVLAFLSVRLLNVLKRRRALYLALDGEMAIGQELNQLMLKGYAVYHDFPAEHFNIDHIVVGPGGVFAVETKARPKAITGDGKGDAEVTYDSRTLRFPGWESGEFLEQATRQAIWLSRWLTSAVGETVEVKPVLALPGWFIKRVQRGPVQVINGRDADFLVRPGDAALSAMLIQRIVHQLELRCRTVEPRGYPRRG